MKRIFDFTLSLIGLVCLAPLMAGLVLVIWITEGRPVFYCQERIGRRGKPFRIWKFRSMVNDAARQGGELTVDGDWRITRIGQFLRQTKLDELPQLLNVLLGEMSLVGPRPEVARYVNLYNEEQQEVLELTPGITDVASIRYRNESEELAAYPDPEAAYVAHIMPEKIRLNLEYSRRANVFRDATVILKTLMRIDM